MPRKLTDDEVSRRCQCGLPIDDPRGHRSRCPAAYDRHVVRSGYEDRKRQTARIVAAQFAAGRAYLAGGGRPDR